LWQCAARVGHVVRSGSRTLFVRVLLWLEQHGLTFKVATMKLVRGKNLSA